MRSNPSRWVARTRRSALHAALAGAAAAAVAAFAPQQAHAQTYDCSSADPAMWPPPAKPYFMVAFDTSGSMDDFLLSAQNSCNYRNDRLGHGRCAMKNTFLAFSGQVNFGLATFARKMTTCTAGTCVTDTMNGAWQGCTVMNLTGDAGGTQCQGGCGAEPNANANSTTRAGANIVVPMLQDLTAQVPSNTAELLSWVDNDCTGAKELFATGCTPLNGILRDMYRYYSSQWVYPGPDPGAGTVYPSPLTGITNGERGCRSVNVLLVTDGGESCDTTADAVNAAAALLAGFTKDGITWSVRTFVIDFGDAGASADQIAAAGGTGTAKHATNEAELSIALSNIISSAVKPETCNNADDNCNGCVDEGYKHYCNDQPVASNCCAWTTPAQRTTCLTNYQNSISSGNPSGNLTLLPCTTSAQQQDPNLWLCYDPKESCDTVDNNCQGGVDENVVRCGSPLHCPQAEVCNSLDDNCDGFIDEGGVCGTCVPSQEICDGCDNDCDGVADDGIAPLPCGLASPPNCTGQKACSPPQSVPIGGCVASGGGYGQCSNNPQPETCDNLDNDCDGQVDEGVAATSCVPPGNPGGLVYGGTSQCQMGTQPCGGTCQGGTGPSTEICDGIDNDCDGQVDEAPLFGVGLPCGINTGECSTGLTACVNGALMCQGGVGAQPEVCDGLDNNCNGAIDDAPLADAPQSTQNGCWLEAGPCCQYPATNPDLTWCPPPGATCNGNGSLTAPCNRGTLTCVGGAWTCVNPNPPHTEVCDGVDNDCDGQSDESPLPQVGQPCGSDVGECSPGAYNCVSGVLTCVGGVGPTPEVCDELDNDCNNVVDDGLQSGGPCSAPYDHDAYPGPRDLGICSPGVYQCDPTAGSICVGGVAPSPERCDGIDNDCDGQVDEPGPPPDGIDGTGNPNNPTQVIGDACGTDVGACLPGAYACLNGQVACLGGQGPVVEQCDCQDNDCDGHVDNPNASGGPALCSSGKDCVNNAGQCQCAKPCDSGEFPCPPGQQCVQVTDSQTGNPLGQPYCITDYTSICGDCATKTVFLPNGNVACAPAGTEDANCADLPTCVCKNQNGCREPCFGVICSAGTQCTNHGAQAGTCVSDTNCWHFPCDGCDQACHDGVCVDNPCVNADCPATTPVCKPNADYSGYDCVASCADVQCQSNEVCVDGACQPGCGSACPDGQVCDLAQSPPACVTNLCDPNPCTNGACCDPITGLCGDCTCEGVICPGGQVCQDGSCFGGGSGSGGGSTTGVGGSGGGGTTTSTSTGASGGSGGSGGPGGVWGLPTGGGGCACETGAGAPTGARGAAWALIALAVSLSRRRRRQGAERSSRSASRAAGGARGPRAPRARLPDPRTQPAPARAAQRR